MKRLTIFAAMAACLGLVACDKQADKKPEADPSATATATAAATNTTTPATTAAPTPAPPDIQEADLITPADMDDDAEKTITKKNYKTELATIETEMSKD